jgi:uncharacterized protein (DUF924 family)
VIYAKKDEASQHLLLTDKNDLNNMTTAEALEATQKADDIAQEMFDVLKKHVDRMGGKICVGCLAPLMSRVIGKGFDSGDRLSEEAARVWFYLYKQFEEAAELTIQEVSVRMSSEERSAKIGEIEQKLRILH